MLVKCNFVLELPSLSVTDRYRVLAISTMIVRVCARSQLTVYIIRILFDSPRS